MTTRMAIFPERPHALYAEHGYSPAVRSGDLLFVSGMVGAREDGAPEPDLGAEIRLAFDNLHIHQVMRARMGEHEGVGVMEQLAIGAHARYGFKEFLDPAR